MQKDDINNYSMAQLIDLLAKSTKELLILMNKKGGDGILVSDKGKQVQMMQDAIDKRRVPERKNR